MGEQFIKVAKSLYGWDTIVDAQDFKTINKTSRWAKWINPYSGKRSDAAHGYVHPVMDTQDNLHLLVESKVVRVLFEGKKSGLELNMFGSSSLRNNSNQSKLFAKENEVEEAPATIRARKVVVVSAGALSTPLILQRSGVGCRSHLKSVGLNHVVSDLQVMGNQWDRTMRRRGGDFSVALANYYPASVDML